MKKSIIMSLYVIVAMTLLYCVPEAGAWINYDDDGYGGCKECHGDFRQSPYNSLADNASWGDDLHDIHRRNMLGGDCNTCHSGSSRYPVYLDSSNGGSAGDNTMSCLNCHGRIEDASPGAGLRQHHWNAWDNDPQSPDFCIDCRGCLECHDDSDPSNYTPVGEDVLPPFYYANSSFPSKPSDPCNPAPEYPEDYAGSLSGLDNDGDGLYDENDPDCSTVPVCSDNDTDGYGNPGDESCDKGAANDCNDDDAAINPGAAEVCDGIDNNCDGNIDEGFASNVEMCDGIDNNCDGQTDEGCDCTDKSTRPCGISTGECLPGEEICVKGQWGNCSGGVSPAPETCDGKDNNCDGRIDDGVTNACGTCGAVPTEVCDGIDNDCDGTVDEGLTNACGTCGEVPAEVCDGIDNDCDGAVDNGIADTPTTCGQGECSSTGVLQCVNGGLQDTCAPGSPSAEVCGDGVDQDCDGSDLECPLIDSDEDGFPEDVDCNDSDPAVNPGAEDICNDGIDQDCSGEDRTKGKGCKIRGVKEDRGGREDTGKTCSDLIDNDGDGLFDCDDSGCSGKGLCK
ncbi:MAG: putative metal-binding motif-containing protein [Nitrospiraceae bacterium]|nr:MAG: putative metal-binding motif-containing protein [Nitrospiraceae bacterium]